MHTANEHTKSFSCDDNSRFSFFVLTDGLFLTSVLYIILRWMFATWYELHTILTQPPFLPSWQTLCVTFVCSAAWKNRKAYHTHDEDTICQSIRLYKLLFARPSTLRDNALLISPKMMKEKEAPRNAWSQIKSSKNSLATQKDALHERLISNLQLIKTLFNLT